MKRRRGVGEAEEHDFRLEESVIRCECGLPFVTFFDVDIVISPTDVEFREILGLAQSVDDVGCEWKWITVLDGDIV